MRLDVETIIGRAYLGFIFGGRILWWWTVRIETFEKLINFGAAESFGVQRLTNAKPKKRQTVQKL